MGDTLGKRIKARRLALGVSQIGLAEAVGVRNTTMLRYEKDEITPSAETLEKIAEALGVSSRFLVRGQDAPASESRVDRSDADPLPPEEEADLAIVQQRKGLTDDEVEKLRAVRRSIGPMNLENLLQNASTIVANRSGKAIDRGQVAETKVPGNLKRFGKRGRP